MDSTPAKDKPSQTESTANAHVGELSESQDPRLAALDELTRLSQELGMGYEK